jgi:hypothetical protein
MKICCAIMLACCQKPDAKAVDRDCLENLAHFELRFVKNLGTLPKYAFFMPTSSLLPRPAMPSKKSEKCPTANKSHPQHQRTVNHMIGMNFAFTHYSPYLAAVMASRQGQKKVFLIRGLVVETHNVHKTCRQFIVPFYP